MVDGAALEMLCPARDLGFESLTLRQSKGLADAGPFFLCARDSNPEKAAKE